MLVNARVGLAFVAGCAVVALAGCTSSEPTPAPAPTRAPIDAGAMRAALLQAKQIGSTWTETTATRPSPLVPLCGGGEEAPPVPGSPTVVSSSLTDAGAKGAQTLDQAALVYTDATEAAAGLAALQVSAEACAPSVQVPEGASGAAEPAYTETFAVTPLAEGEWSGFRVERHKTYDPAHPAAADTSVAVLTARNVLLVDAYAIYVLKATAPAPQFDTDWRRLLGATLRRIIPTS